MLLATVSTEPIWKDMCQLAGLMIAQLLITKLAIVWRRWHVVISIGVLASCFGLNFLLITVVSACQQGAHLFLEPIWWEVLIASIFSLATGIWGIRSFRNRQSMSPGPLDF